MKSISFEDSDNLSLKTFSVEKESISIDNDLVRNLRDENGRIIQLLREKEFEITKLKRNFDKKEICKENFSEGAASLKIIELSKKLREVTADCESWKTKYYQKEKEIKNSINEAKLKKNEEKRDELPASETESELKIVKDKLRSTENKVCELLTTNQSQSRDLKIAMKVLENEIGESCVDIGRLLKDPSQWRGRAQKIMSLKDNVDRLEKQLKEEQRSSMRQICSGATSLGLPHSTSASSLSASPKTYKNEVLIKIEKEKRMNLDKIEEDRKKMLDDYEKLKSVCDGLKARNKCLSDEVKSLKQQIKNMLDKTKNDDELIATLILQQDRLKASLQSVINSQQSTQINNVFEINQAASQFKQDHDTVQKLKEIIDLKDKEIRSMKENKVESKCEKKSSDDLFNVDYEQLKISSVSMSTEITQLRELIQTEELRLESLLQKNMALSEENACLKQNYLQIEREIQKVAPNSKYKSKLKMIQLSERTLEGNLATLLSQDIAVNKETVEKLQEEIYLRVDKIESLKNGLELMSAAKKEDVKMLTDIIDQTRNQFVDGIKKLKEQCLNKDN